jgi:hypothetical protein
LLDLAETRGQTGRSPSFLACAEICFHHRLRWGSAAVLLESIKKRPVCPSVSPDIPKLEERPTLAKSARVGHPRVFSALRVCHPAAVGVEVGVVAERAGVVGHDAGGAEEVFDIILRAAAGGKHSDAFACEENVFVKSGAGRIGFGEDFAAGAIPIELAADLGSATTGAVVKIGHAVGAFDFAFGVVGVCVSAVALRIAGGVVGEDGELIVAVGSGGKAAFFGAAGVTGVGSSGDAVEVAPGIVAPGKPVTCVGVGGRG